MANLSSTYKKAGIKGMGETNGGYDKKSPKAQYQKAYNISPRLEGETVADWIQRCKK